MNKNLMENKIYTQQQLSTVHVAAHQITMQIWFFYYFD
jgi:hypothetical protein